MRRGLGFGAGCWARRGVTQAEAMTAASNADLKSIFMEPAP